MRLNLDYVRDILICVEENTDLNNDCYFFERGRFDPDPDNERLPSYQKELQKGFDNGTLLYHVHYCVEAGLLRKNISYENFLRIADLTPAGHEFLNNIREENVWNGIKSVSSKVGAKSMEAVAQIASNVISELIRSYFKIT